MGVISQKLFVFEWEKLIEEEGGIRASLIASFYSIQLASIGLL